MKRGKKLKSLYIFQLSRKGLALSLTGGFFILLWIFILGILVDRYLTRAPLVMKKPPGVHMKIQASDVKKGLSVPKLIFPEVLFEGTTETGRPERFSVQVGAFKDLEAARNVVKILKNKGYHARVASSKNSEEGTWYKVRLGPFETKKGANTFARRIKEVENIKDAFVVRDSK